MPTPPMNLDLDLSSSSTLDISTGAKVGSLPPLPARISASSPTWLPWALGGLALLLAGGLVLVLKKRK